MTGFSLATDTTFSLAASSAFVEGFAAGQGGSSEPRLDMAFPLDRTWQPVGVRVVEDEQGLRAEVVHNPQMAPVDDIRRNVRQILSLDVDGSGFADVGKRDPVVAKLQKRYPGLRPVQFYSPYEAAAWTIIGNRIRIPQAARIRDSMGHELGEEMRFADLTLASFPHPAVLADLKAFPGLNSTKIARLNALGQAALDGRLDRELLAGLAPDEALERLQTLPGIGPFSSELILLRGVGTPDGFPSNERRLQRAMAALYELGEDPEIETLVRIAERWRPYRMWVALLIRRWLEDTTGEIAKGTRAAALPKLV